MDFKKIIKMESHRNYDPIKKDIIIHYVKEVFHLRVCNNNLILAIFQKI